MWCLPERPIYVVQNFFQLVLWWWLTVRSIAVWSERMSHSAAQSLELACKFLWKQICPQIFNVIFNVAQTGVVRNDSRLGREVARKIAPCTKTHVKFDYFFRLHCALKMLNSCRHCFNSVHDSISDSETTWSAGTKRVPKRNEICKKHWHFFDVFFILLFITFKVGRAGRTGESEHPSYRGGSLFPSSLQKVALYSRVPTVFPYLGWSLFDISS